MVIGALLLLPCTNASAQAPGTFTETGSMSIQRVQAAETLLLNGTVLVAGGEDSTGLSRGTAEIYNRSTGQFTTTGSMILARRAHTATLLQNGKVLIAGGIDNNNLVRGTAEIYDPSTGQFSATGSMIIARAFHTATLLINGKVLITGGKDNNNTVRGTAELYDPSTGQFTSTGSMNLAREFHTATGLANGKVLVAGGDDGNNFGPANTAEIYDPASGSFSFTANQMAHDHFEHAAALLANGKVLVAGGFDSTLNAASWAELYDPASDSFSSTGNMNVARKDFTLTPLSDSQVLVVGSSAFTSNGPTDVNTAELYDPSSGTFAFTGNTVSSGRVFHVAALLSDGQVLIAGGDATAELYTPPSMPEVKISSPINGATVAGTTSLFTEVASNVLWINVYIDGSYLVSSPPYEFSWNTTKLSNGSHMVSIKGFNGSNTQVGSDSIHVTVANGTSPVKITAPPNGSTVSGTVSIQTQIGSQVLWENIYIDGHYFASSPPDNFNWNSATVPNGAHTISAKAFNSSDQQIGSDQVTVTVAN